MIASSSMRQQHQETRHHIWAHLCATRARRVHNDRRSEIRLMLPLLQLFAFERDRKRYSTLKTMLSKAACRNVEPVNVDFLTVDPRDPKYSAATHMWVYRVRSVESTWNPSILFTSVQSLLDPSCSGSGIINRLDHLLENGRRRELFLLLIVKADDRIQRRKTTSVRMSALRNSPISSWQWSVTRWNVSVLFILPVSWHDFLHSSFSQEDSLFHMLHLSSRKRSGSLWIVSKWPLLTTFTSVACRTRGPQKHWGTGCQFQTCLSARRFASMAQTRSARWDGWPRFVCFFITSVNLPSNDKRYAFVVIKQPMLHHYCVVHLITMQPMVSLFPALSGTMGQAIPALPRKGKMVTKGDRMEVGAANERKRKKQKVWKGHNIRTHIFWCFKY